MVGIFQRYSNHIPKVETHLLWHYTYSLKLVAHLPRNSGSPKHTIVNVEVHVHTYTYIYIYIGIYILTSIHASRCTRQICWHDCCWDNPQYCCNVGVKLKQSSTWQHLVLATFGICLEYGWNIPTIFQVYSNYNRLNNTKPLLGVHRQVLAYW